MSRSTPIVLFLASLATGCYGGGGGADQVDVRVSGKAYVGGGSTSGGILLDPASLGQEPNGSPHLLTVTLVINGTFTESGGYTCNEPDPIWMSNSITLTLDAAGNYEATGAIPMHGSGGGGDVPGGCKERTGVAIDDFESITLEGRLPTIPWNDYNVWMACQTQAYVACEGSTDINCPTVQTKACRDAAWAQTLWHRVTGAECVDNGSYMCGADPNFPITAKLTIPASAMGAINDGYFNTGTVEISSELVYQFNE